MLDNHVYNLITQLSQEHKSLWRIKNHYVQDAGDCEECKEFWRKMIDDKQEHIDDLLELLKNHIA